MAHKIVQAELPRDNDVVAELFTGYLGFLRERVPDEWENICQKYDLARMPAFLEQFAKIHSPPEGALLLAYLDDQPVGCGMMQQFEPGIIEIQRVFVTEAGRGRGLGRALTIALMDAARAHGQKLARLDTGRRLHEAIGLYKALGFRERSPYHANTPQLDHVLVYFECEL